MPNNLSLVRVAPSLASAQVSSFTGATWCSATLSFHDQAMAHEAIADSQVPKHHALSQGTFEPPAERAHVGAPP